MSNKLRNIFFIIGFAVFGYFIYSFGIRNILDNLYQTGWWFFPIFAVWGVVYLLNTAAWYFILKDEDSISFFDLLPLTISGFAINYITPFINLGGEPYRILSLKDKLGSRRAVSSTITYSMLHFLSSFVFWIFAVFLVFFFIPLPKVIDILLLIFLIACFLFVLFFRARHKKGIVKSFAGLLKKVPLGKSLKKKLIEKEDSFENIDQQITDLYNNKKKYFYISLSLEVAARIISSFEFYFILKAIGYDTNFAEIIFINGFAALVMNIFFFMPLELGARESGLYLVFEFIKLPASLGIFASLVNRIREFFWILIGLLLIELSGKKFSRKKLSEVNYDESNIV